MTDVPAAFPATAARFLLPGAAGAIEVATDVPATPRLGTALICHPHPLHGGSMQNKVVTTVERALRELGLRTLRFNFRGVGQSEGTFDDGIGEGGDLVRLAQWVRGVRPRDALWLAGFSFGAYVAAARAAEIAPAQLISLAPPVGRWHFDAIADPGCPWLAVQPEADEVVDADAVYAWAAQPDSPVELVRLPGASHFFHGQLNTLREIVQTHVRAPLPAVEA
jgi:alpha/beta superfamily hydrolase